MESQEALPATSDLFPRLLRRSVRRLVSLAAGCIGEDPHLRSCPVTKKAAIARLLVLLISFWLGACASSSTDTLGSPSSAQTGSDVPGEKMSDDRLAPGPMGSTNVRW